MRVKVKSPAATKVVTINDSATFDQFSQECCGQYGLFTAGEQIVALKTGFPPKPADITDTSKSLKDLGIVSGDQVIIEISSAASKPVLVDKHKLAESTEIPSVYIESLDKFLILRNIPDDNSCMFNAISQATTGAFAVKELREICSRAILADPEKYSEVILGRTNSNYANWIKQKDSWGGAIELGILANVLDLTINCIDIESGNTIKFETENNLTPHFIYLVYSGIHYDLLVVNGELDKVAKNSDDIAVWSKEETDPTPVHEAAAELCKKLQTKNYTTNTTTFRVRCLECYEVLVGENGAAKHANSTGHFKFGEVTK